MDVIRTTGGLFTEESRRIVLSNICKVFECEESDIEELEPVQAGLTNVVLSFRLNGGKYVYRHPGLGSEILVERGRETIMQKIVEDAGIDTTLIAMDVDEVWRISRFINHWDFDYKNMNDMVRAIMLFRRLHAAPCHVRWNFDVIKKAEGIRDQIDPEKYGHFPDFENVKARIYTLAALAEHDGIKPCFDEGISVCKDVLTEVVLIPLSLLPHKKYPLYRSIFMSSKEGIFNISAYFGTLYTGIFVFGSK